MKNKKMLYMPLGFRKMSINYQDNGSTAENSSTKSIFKKIYPLIYPLHLKWRVCHFKYFLFAIEVFKRRIAILPLNGSMQWSRDNARWKFKKLAASRTSKINASKKIIGNKSLILNLVIKTKYLITLLLKKNSIPKKIYRLNKCFFFRKKPKFTKNNKNNTVFFNFHLKNFHKSLKHEFTPYFTQSTIRLKNNKQLAITTGLVIKKNNYTSKKIKNKNFSLIRRSRAIKSKLINEMFSLKQYSHNRQQTNITYYTNPINSLFKPHNPYKKIKNPAPSVYYSHGLVKKNSISLINNKKSTRALAKLSQLHNYTTRINPMSKVNESGFSNLTEKILRLKTRIKNQSRNTLESYEVLNNKTLTEKPIVILGKQLFDIKKDTEALLQFTRKMLMSNKPPIVKTYTYDFL